MIQVFRCNPRDHEDYTTLKKSSFLLMVGCFSQPHRNSCERRDMVPREKHNKRIMEDLGRQAKIYSREVKPLAYS